jgi:hypothetical protein
MGHLTMLREKVQMAGARTYRPSLFQFRKETKMTKIIRYLFGNEFAKTIATRTLDGQHWYMALDICNLVGIKNHSQAVHRFRERDELSLTEEEWRKETIYIGGYGKKKVLMVNDNGVLKLILQGKSPRACEAQERARQTPSNLIPETWETGLMKAEN